MLSTSGLKVQAANGEVILRNHLLHHTGEENPRANLEKALTSQEKVQANLEKAPRDHHGVAQANQAKVPVNQAKDRANLARDQYSLFGLGLVILGDLPPLVILGDLLPSTMVNPAKAQANLGKDPTITMPNL
jgi:hypothetical protein